MTLEAEQGFLLTRQWRDTPKGVELELWVASDAGPVRLHMTAQEGLFFLAADVVDQAEKLLAGQGWYSKPLDLIDFSQRPIVGCYFKQQRQLRLARERLREAGLDPLEADINPCDRFLMERFVRGSLLFKGALRARQSYRYCRQPEVAASDYQPTLRSISLDIETAIDRLQLFSIAVYARDHGAEVRKVFIVSDESLAEGINTYADESSLLQGFFAWLDDYDPDVIIGWNVINFDCWYLQRVCNKYRMDLCLGRGGGKVFWRELDDEGARRAITVPGRVVLDGIELLKGATWRFESFALNAVASELLGEAKLIQDSDRGGKITELFHHNPQQLADYNLQDCVLVWKIFERAGLLDFAVARSKLTGLPLDRIGGSVASFDFRYLPLLHRHGFVAPNGHWVDEIEHSPGGFVMESRPGIYQHVIVLDFKSLYPSIIRSFKIDPMGMAIGLSQELDQADLVPGFKGAWFDKKNNLLPEIINELWLARDVAKQESNQPLSQAIKIIMNSFYGVLGSAGCRFFDSRLASSITRRGHQILQETAAFIEQQGWPVIYGDTDSVFVWLNAVNNNDEAIAVGEQLALQLNDWWQQRLLREYAIESYLEIEFETHYQKFLMPTIRGSEKGSKKRYAGVVSGAMPRLVFKGLENVRTDWTRLAREFQQELYRRIFFDEPYRDYIKSLVTDLLAGQYNDQLVYRKRLRRKLEDYQRNIPPHVQAARKAVETVGVTLHRGDWVEYVITVNGPEPVLAQVSKIDYQHIIDRQLAPVADGILYFLEDSLASIIDRQMAMF